MKVIIAPQEFKGSVKAREVALAMREGVKRAIPYARVHLLPVADGGDGTLDILTEDIRTCQATDPLGQKISVPWGVLSDTAVIEMAKVSGLSLIPQEEQNPLLTTSFGLGEVIEHILDQGYRKFLIGIGGSATNDAGVGMAEALGAVFLNKNGEKIRSLKELERIDLSNLDPRLQECSIEVACDVTNTITGPEGATAIYAPQKGATPAMVEELEAALCHFVEIADSNLSTLIGGGAAGGLGAGAAFFLNAKLQPGIDLILDYLHFDEFLQGADLVITGEGRLEHQALYHKAPLGVALRAKKQNIPTLAIVGSLGVGYSAVHQYGIDAVIPLNFSKETVPKIPVSSAKLIAQATEEALRCARLLIV